MEKDAVRNQKVFVSLDSVLEIQDLFNRRVEACKSMATEDGKARIRQELRGMKSVIEKLGLGIKVDMTGV